MTPHGSCSCLTSPWSACMVNQLLSREGTPHVDPSTSAVILLTALACLVATSRTRRFPGTIAETWAAAAEHYDESQLSGLLLEIGAINRVESPERC